MAIRALLVDFYGTIVREDDGIIKDICRRIAESSPQVVNPGDVGRAWWEAMDEECHVCFGESFKPLRQLEHDVLAGLLNRYESHCDLRELTTALYASRDFPQAFQDGRVLMARLPIKALVVANGDREDLTRAAVYTQIDITEIHCSEDARCYKPRTEIFLQAVEILGVSPDETLHIGDSIHYDIMPAQQAGLHTVWINRLGRTVPPGCIPDMVVENLAQLRRLIK